MDMSAGHIASRRKRTDIEGLRAVAVALVVLYHARAGLFTGGYVGVDVFFVVSGFLITNILLDGLNTSNTILLRNFWARRMRRIVPMASFVVVLTVIASYLFLEAGRGPDLIPVALGAIGFCANIVLFNTTGDYLSGVELPSPLQHFWSLGVEEQFYVFWPIIVLIVARLARARWRIWVGVVCLVLFAWSLFESMRITPIDRGGGYYLPQARAWEILAGALLAILGTRLHRLPNMFCAAVGWAGLGALVYSATLFNDETNFPGHLALVPVLGTVAVLIAREVRFGPVMILRWTPLQLIGRWSFSIYLWHWPVLVIAEAQFGVLSGVQSVVAVAVCVALSAVSYTLVERPIQWSRYLTVRPMRTFTIGFSVLALLLASGTVLMATRQPADDTPGFVAPAGLDEARQEAVEVNNAPTTTAPADVTTTLPVVHPVNALLVGDSVLAAVRYYEQGSLSMEGFNYVLDAESCRRLTSSGCLGKEERIPNSATDVVEDFAGPLGVVVLVGGYHSSKYSLRAELQEFAASVSAKRAKLVILTFKETLKYRAPGSGGTRSIYSDFNDIVREMAAAGELGDVTVADWNLFSYEQEGWFRRDGMHLSIIGTLAMGWMISASIAALFDNPCPFDGTYPCVVPAIADPTIDWLTRYNAVFTEGHCYEDGPRRVRDCDPRPR
ncbi:MAG: acyltransferase family protein [Ilumatobacteraceae bacterium]